MEVEEYEGKRSGGAMWLYAPLVLILFVGGAFSVAAYNFEPSLTVSEALVAGFGGLAALIVGLIAAVFGVLVGLIGAVFGLAVGGGAIALTLFIVASPVIAIVLFVLLMRRPKGCPDSSVHEIAPE